MRIGFRVSHIYGKTNIFDTICNICLVLISWKNLNTLDWSFYTIEHAYHEALEAPS